MCCANVDEIHGNNGNHELFEHKSVLFFCIYSIVSICIPHAFHTERIVHLRATKLRINWESIPQQSLFHLRNLWLEVRFFFVFHAMFFHEKTAERRIITRYLKPDSNKNGSGIPTFGSSTIPTSRRSRFFLFAVLDSTAYAKAILPRPFPAFVSDGKTHSALVCVAFLPIAFDPFIQSRFAISDKADYFVRSSSHRQLGQAPPDYSASCNSVFLPNAGIIVFEKVGVF